MFRLDARIEDWKNDLRQLETLRNDDIEELEQHVRDSIVGSMSRGLTEEESFWVATGRLGESGSLACEFEKVNGGRLWAQRLFWMLGGFLLFEMCRFAIAAIAQIGQILAGVVGGGGALMGGTAAGLSFLSWFLVLALVYGSYRSRSQSRSLSRFLTDSSGLKIGAGIAIVLLGSGVIRLGAIKLIAEQQGPAALGIATMITTAASALLAALVPLACLLAMLDVRRRIRVVSDRD